MKPHIKFNYKTNDKKARWVCHCDSICVCGETMREAYVVLKGFLGMINIEKGKTNVH